MFLFCMLVWKSKICIVLLRICRLSNIDSPKLVHTFPEQGEGNILFQRRWCWRAKGSMRAFMLLVHSSTMLCPKPLYSVPNKAMSLLKVSFGLLSLEGSMKTAIYDSSNFLCVPRWPNQLKWFEEGYQIMFQRWLLSSRVPFLPTQKTMLGTGGDGTWDPL